MNTTKRPSKQTITLDSETAAAVDDALRWIESVTCGSLCESPHEKKRCLNSIIRAACEAVVNYEPHTDTNQCVNFMDVKTSRVVYSWPPAFDARPETEEELDLRVMLSSPPARKGGRTP